MNEKIYTTMVRRAFSGGFEWRIQLRSGNTFGESGYRTWQAAADALDRVVEVIESPNRLNAASTESTT